MNITEPKCLIYAKSQYPELEPVDGLRMLAKLHTSREIAELCGSSWATISTRCKRHGISCIRAKARIKKTTEKEKQVVLFFCAKCKSKKSVELESRQSGICTKCELNNRRSRV